MNLKNRYIGDDLKILDDRFWLQVVEGFEENKNGSIYRMGLLKALADKIGPTVFVSRQVMPGSSLLKGELLYVVESTKAAMDIEAPLSLTVHNVNTEIEKEPHLLFEDPEKRGWLLEVSLLEM